jgi:hypothetical protein
MSFALSFVVNATSLALVALGFVFAVRELPSPWSGRVFGTMGTLAAVNLVFAIARDDLALQERARLRHQSDLVMTELVLRCPGADWLHDAGGNRVGVVCPLHAIAPGQGSDNGAPTNMPPRQ